MPDGIEYPVRRSPVTLKSYHLAQSRMHEALERWLRNSATRRVRITDDSVTLSEQRGNRIVYRRYANQRAAVWAVMQGMSI